MTCNTAQGDIDLRGNLQDREMYYYSAGEMSKVKSYFFSTTASLPPYFSNPDPTGVVGTIQDRLKAAMDRAAVIDLSGYASLISTSLDGDSVFASLTP